MNVQVRLSAGLAQHAGTSRLIVQLANDATVADLVVHLRSEYPALASRLELALPFVGGQNVSESTTLVEGQEVAFLLPAAGGRS